MRSIRYRCYAKWYKPDRDVIQSAQRRYAVKLRQQQGWRPRPPAQRGFGDDELEALASGKEGELAVQPCREYLRNLLFQVGRLEHGEHPACVLRGLQQPGDQRRLEGQHSPRARLQVLDVALDMRSLLERAAPVMHLGVHGLSQGRQQVGNLWRCSGGGCPRRYLWQWEEYGAGLGPRDLRLADADALRELAPGKAGQFSRAPQLGFEPLALAQPRSLALAWANHAVIPDPSHGLSRRGSSNDRFKVIQSDSCRFTSKADSVSARQVGRPKSSFANRAERLLPATALWLLTLSVVYAALRQSGVYGLVGDAQNLIAIFGVLHAAVYAIARQTAQPWELRRFFGIRTSSRRRSRPRLIGTTWRRSAGCHPDGAGPAGCSCKRSELHFPPHSLFRQ